MPRTLPLNCKACSSRIRRSDGTTIHADGCPLDAAVYHALAAAFSDLHRLEQEVVRARQCVAIAITDYREQAIAAHERATLDEPEPVVDDLDRWPDPPTTTTLQQWHHRGRDRVYLDGIDVTASVRRILSPIPSDGSYHGTVELFADDDGAVALALDDATEIVGGRMGPNGSETFTATGMIRVVCTCFDEPDR